MDCLSLLNYRTWQIHVIRFVIFLTVALLTLGQSCFMSVTVLCSWASYQMRKIAGWHVPGMSGTLSPHQLQRKPLVSDPGMHHSTRFTHVPWCMSGSLIHGGGNNVPGIPGACATRNFTYLASGPWKVCAQSDPTKPQQSQQTCMCA